MKSWSLGRKSKKSQQTPETSPTRPKSMVKTFPTSSSGAELSSTIQASPSLTYSTSSARSRQSSNENELGSSPSASKYLSTAQLKDKIRRLKSPMTTTTEFSTTTTTTTTNSPSSRPPLTAKNNTSSNSSPRTSLDGRTRTPSLPSLIKAPNVISPTPSAPLVSPAAAVVGGRPSIETDENDPFNDSPSTERGSILPSTTPQRDSLAPLEPNQLNHTCDVDVPKQSAQSQSQAPPITPNKENEEMSKTRKASEVVATKEEESSPHPTAVASLRRFKGVEGYGSLERVKHARFDTMTVKESEEKEKGAITTSQQKTSATNTSKEQQQKYPFAVRKNRSGTKAQQHQQHNKAMIKRNTTKRQIEAKYDVAIVSQRVLSLSFGRAKAGSSTTAVHHQRRLVAVPIPTLFGCDKVASWTVERISRFTSCLINVFGS